MIVGIALLACITPATVLINGGTLVHGVMSSDFRLAHTFRVPGFIGA